MTSTTRNRNANEAKTCRDCGDTYTDRRARVPYCLLCRPHHIIPCRQCGAGIDCDTGDRACACACACACCRSQESLF